jgi:hypothetical protein
VYILLFLGPLNGLNFMASYGSIIRVHGGVGNSEMGTTERGFL